MSVLQTLLLTMSTQNLNLNPSTGDVNAKVMGFVIAALVVSAILIVVFAVTSKKKGKKKKRK